MSGERNSTESAKFAVGIIYTKAEFLYRLELLLHNNATNDDVVEVLRENIAWAEKHPDNTTFVWEQASNGYVYPHATVETEGFPIVPNLPPEV